MVRNSTILVVLVLTAAIGWLWARGDSGAPVADAPVVASPEQSTAAVPQPVAEGGPAVEIVSLPAFAQQEFSGSDFTVGRIITRNDAYIQHYITYRSNGLLISGIMNIPTGPGPFPVLVLGHGYIDPAVYTNGRGLRREQDYLARRGFAVIHPDYRNHADSDDDPETDERFRFGYAADVINVVQAVRQAQVPALATDRVGMLGHSMGGGVAWKIATARPDLLRAFVLFAPVSADERDNFEKWIRRRPETAAAIVAAHGEPADNPDFWDGISPLTYFDRLQAPVLIHHGAADASVPLAWSERAAAAAAGKDVMLRVYPGEPHEFTAAWSGVMAETAQFFTRHLAAGG